MDNCNQPVSKNHFYKIKKLLVEKSPFVFVRFSDGETEIIKNHYLEITTQKVIWSGGVSGKGFPVFDQKKFNPLIHQQFRKDLLKAAMLDAPNYYKGIPTSHNAAEQDRNLMIRLNGGLSSSLTFSDLFLNGNFLHYRKKIVPIFDTFNCIAIIGNYRMNPKLYRKDWKHIKIPDNFFETYEDVKNTTWNEINSLPIGTLVLSSASSLSNILGVNVYLSRPDITFLDIGTTLHDIMGMQSGIRGYHIELEPWSVSNFYKKIRYKMASEYKLRW
jgi:hypothetical protein